uniref:Uncharacterized protein n=1 Tax=Oryza glumipatula TaxID=40148 RepID=A0A0D9YST1_9ORYZ
MKHYKCLDKIGRKSRVWCIGGINYGKVECFREPRCLEACQGHPYLVEHPTTHREMKRGGDGRACPCCYVMMEYINRSSLVRVVQEERRDN